MREVSRANATQLPTKSEQFGCVQLVTIFVCANLFTSYPCGTAVKKPRPGFVLIGVGKRSLSIPLCLNSSPY